MLYADIIVDISHENLDRSYQYAVPEAMEAAAVPGAPVEIPFGNSDRTIKGYIIGVGTVPKIEPSRIKEIRAVKNGGIVMESRMIALAARIKERYGGTMNDALRTVMPVKKEIRAVNKRTVYLNLPPEQARELLETAIRKHHTAKERLLKELIAEGEMDFDMLVGKLNISRKTLTDFEKSEVVRIETTRQYRNSGNNPEQEAAPFPLNAEQQSVTDCILSDYRKGIRKTYLIHGVTGSGKTEVYLAVIEQVIAMGRQVIMMIPEIALTYQTMKRFHKRFGERVSFLHSRLSDGERYDQYLRAKQGEIDVMIGPRSALFTPFADPGLIIIDEEHEGSYKSEQIPKYHAREVAVEYAAMTDASVILGSATPSLESYYRARCGEYQLLTLPNRAGEGRLPKCHIVDMREELKEHNPSIFSRKLRSLIEDRLAGKQQVMIFINRRGYAGFVSCRSCGEALMCPHCAVSLTAHNNKQLVCHYCGYETTMPEKCPNCGSKYIAAFGTGTQKVEALIQKEFPNARVLRMDADTTRKKEGHEQILSAFSNEEADILVGTQMIVKGHDFARVTLMGILAADLSLQSADYRAGERTFQLLAQAAGRAGRAGEAGEVVIQTYKPEHYSVIAAATEDYASFYQSEFLYRNLMGYPPASNLLAVLVSSGQEAEADACVGYLADRIKEWMEEHDATEEGSVIGPAPAGISKLRDSYRFVIYVKHPYYGILTACKDACEQLLGEEEGFKNASVQFDFNPMTTY